MQRQIVHSVRSTFSTVFALALLVSPAFCSTWIVDQANGPGTNYIDIPPAVAIAVPGDVIIVRAGTYSSFTLSKGVTVLGQGSVMTNGDIILSLVPVGQIAALVNVEPVTSYLNEVQVKNCQGTVLVQRVDTTILVYDSTDVRILDVTSGPIVVRRDAGVSVYNARAQIVQAIIQGGQGAPGFIFGPTAEDGAAGLAQTGFGRVHFSLSQARGGPGGLSDGYVHGGNGGPGLSVFASSNVHPLMVLTGGPVGLARGGMGWSGYEADSFWVGAHARTSQMTYQPTPPVIFSSGLLTTQPTIEPTLEMIGTPSPGATIRLRLRAQPGTSATLNCGTTPQVLPSAGVLVENLAVLQTYIPLGTVPLQGSVDVNWSFRLGVPLGQLQIFQARIVDPGVGTVHRSNSIEAIVR
ncbi:MAG TPA: hypothetical protein VK843_15075 [Planctomycetota bacterium]|nr:hypothetical protein [Planctomycetota bacterium]